MTYWQDPDFDPEHRAFCSVRVIEIPTPRDSLPDSIALGIDCKETDRPTTIQERATRARSGTRPNWSLTAILSAALFSLGAPVAGEEEAASGSELPDAPRGTPVDLMSGVTILTC